ncbi:MAG: adenylosuccinate lyase, adenylosuccinate lyase [Candidatus Gottesmanbacteria bacterium GW2011_GWA2_43_14]|uniref:Adenylosuccinate lyase, adenylosuccinate lyase n=1 Tax=Candidatus Gottesmanbacteria bacterium GW2011_GWA2_43_14 TaxID=1618443 RepID=A0A0G1DLL8_9BACT|nr:MAG: adenylosuccinate lyase, adenylosuccinate lyase [Candidatus Gottesmanbacteria bacterium GW2011_GWA2_43_14]
MNSQLLNISIVDGRYRHKLEKLSGFFSEYALILYRLKVEISYLLFLCNKAGIFRKISAQENNLLQHLILNFNLKEAEKVKAWEQKTNHDVKAIEYYLSEKLEQTTLKDLRKYIHFGLTSYDTNTIAYALILKESREAVLLPELKTLIKKLKKKVSETKDYLMLARTHGQPALPTTMGKELAVYLNRLNKFMTEIENHQFEAKLNGAVGNYSALSFSFPAKNWLRLTGNFIGSLGLVTNELTTQILPYDNWLAYLELIKRLNYVLAGFCQDIWWYISFEYFLQLKKKSEVGSSTMAQKINPIYFENAEGNLLAAGSMFEFFCRKLSSSRLQRDLTDSTVKRNFGYVFGLTLLGWNNISRGLELLQPNKVKLAQDLSGHWEIMAEGVQIYLKKYGLDRAFNIVKEKFRGKVLDRDGYYRIIDQLDISQDHKNALKLNDLGEYAGLTDKLVDLVLKS